MVPSERLKPMAPLSQVTTLPMVDSTGIIQLFGHCIATWYVMSRSYLKPTEIGTSCGHG